MNGPSDRFCVVLNSLFSFVSLNWNCFRLLDLFMLRTSSTLGFFRLLMFMMIVSAYGVFRKGLCEQWVFSLEFV